MTAIKIEKTNQSRLNEIDFDNLSFGNVFSDHMFSLEYYDDAWQNAQIMPYQPISLEPGAAVFHYGQAVFEGQKAFLTKDGHINIFRLDQNARRLAHSCERLCIPPVDVTLCEEAIKQLVLLDRAWIPKKKGTALYIRPFIFATESFLGVRPANVYRFLVILSPVGAYYKEGFNPVKLMTSGKYARAFRGGVGNVKAAANYAISLYPAQEAKKKGFTQVVWLDAFHNRYIEEAGTMNLFCHIGNELLTPPLDDGSILPGVTRDCVIRLAKEIGLTVRERRIKIDEVIQASEEGTLKEIFGSGTAAVISPVGELEHEGRLIVINKGKTGEVAQWLFDQITGIQYGEKPDNYNWCQTL